MVAGEAHSKFGVQISYCGRQCILPQYTAQPAMPEKMKCCSGWISMVYSTAPT